VALLGLSDRPNIVRRSIQNTLGWHTGLWWVPTIARMDPTVPGRGKKNTRTGSSLPCQRVAGRPSMDPLAVSLVPQKPVQPGRLSVKMHKEPLGWWCNVYHCQHNSKGHTLFLTTLPDEAADHMKAPREHQTV
jgi:hypothetical protein